jgi:nicotinate-nucleotide pyrophosphorylase (carboxylating)
MKKFKTYDQNLTLEQRLRAALWEDLRPNGDVTTSALAPENAQTTAWVKAKAPGVLCGVKIFQHVMKLAAEFTDRKVKCMPFFGDGQTVKPGDRVLKMTGAACAILLGERTALNLLCRLSGVATLTSHCVRQTAGTKADVTDTRKTTPLWRDLEKYAVRCGGGVNHRFNLSDMTLIKDNHLAWWDAADPAGAVRAAQQKFPQLPVMVEVTDLCGLRQVCENSTPKYVLLDNFTPAQLREAVVWRNRFWRKRFGNSYAAAPILEASGGVTLNNIRLVAKTGVERISCGALTHSAPALDFSLLFAKRAKPKN